MVYAGQALWQRYRTEAEVVAELVEKNVQISPREVSWLSMRFVAYLAMAHQHSVPEIKNAMQMHGGYICHLDATCEGRDPLLMSSLDSLSNIVLGNVKLPSEHESHIVPFLQRIKESFGIPLALVHDMGKGILKAVATVFPDVPDFICHFHFLRDIGKDLLGTPYDTIRKRLKAHGISGALRYRARQLKAVMDANPAMITALHKAMDNATLSPEMFEHVPIVAAYTLIQWALKGKSQGDGYGFPFDRPHLSFALRLRALSTEIERIQDIHLRGQWRENDPYFKIHIALKPLIRDKALWKAVRAMEAKISIFEKLRKAMRIALPAGPHGLNDEGHGDTIRTIEARVKAFRAWLVNRKDYAQDLGAHKMIKQIDQYWDKLFADPIFAQTPSGPVRIQPQRTNNILEQFFRSLKRANRRRTGNASTGPALRTMLAETPLIRNLENPAYMKILLNGKEHIEEIFAQIDIQSLREEFRKAQESPERIPRELHELIASVDFPKQFGTAVIKAAA